MSRSVMSQRTFSWLFRSSTLTRAPVGYTLSSGQGQVCQSCQRRSYAAPRAPAVRAPQRIPQRAPQPTQTWNDSGLYNLDGLTVKAFEKIVERHDSFKSLSPAQYYDGLVKFSEAIKAGSSPWSVRLPGADGLSASTMHEIGCMLRHYHTGRNSQALTMALWSSASEMGHRPATLSLARMLIRGGGWYKMRPVEKSRTLFKKIVAEGRDPNALTAEGELLFEEGKYEAAIRTLQRALQLDCPAFEWKPYCQLCLGKAFVKTGRLAEAKAAFEASIEGGSLETDAELGQLLRASDPAQAEQYLFNAAMNDRPEIFAYLSEMALEGQARATDEKTRGEQQRWAMEWARLADPNVPF